MLVEEQRCLDVSDAPPLARQAFEAPRAVGRTRSHPAQKLLEELHVCPGSSLIYTRNGQIMLSNMLSVLRIRFYFFL